MIKLLLGRLLPAAAAGALLTSALSPIKPALHAFAVAAAALAGDTEAGGAPDLGQGISIPHADAPSAPAETRGSQSRLLELAGSLRGDSPKLRTFNAPADRPRRRKR